MKVWTLTACAMAMALASTSHAAAPKKAPAPAAAPAPMGDEHGPRTVTRDEAKAHAEAMFDKLDVNHDGKFDEADRKAMREEHLGKMFDRIDADHNGQITRAEFIAAHDGKRPGHGPAGEPGMAPPPPGPEGMNHAGMDHGMMPPPPPGGPGKPGHGMMRPGMMRMMDMGLMRQADPQHTGTVTKDAFVAAALKHFDEADTNHDGKVTPEERRAARHEMREHRHGGRHGDHRGPGHRGPRHGGPGAPGGDMPPPPPAPPAPGK